MQDALKRLRDLQRQLEDLHRTTVEVLSESQRLVREVQAAGVPIDGPANKAGPLPARKRAKSDAGRQARTRKR